MCTHSQRFPGPWRFCSLVCCGSCQGCSGQMSNIPIILKQQRKQKAAHGRLNVASPAVTTLISKNQEYVKDLLQLCHVPPKATLSDPWRCHKKHCPLLGVQKCSCTHMLSQRILLCLHKGLCSSITTVTIPMIVAAQKPPAKLINLLPSRQSKLSLSSVAQWIQKAGRAACRA